MGRATTCVVPTGAARTRFGEVPRYAEGLHALGHGLFAWLVPNGSWGEANAGLVTGRGASLLIDTLWDVRTTRAMLAAMQPLLAETPIATVVNTHADGDHFWGNQLVAGAELVASAATRQAMAAERPARLRLFKGLGRLLRTLPFRDARQAGHYFATMGAPYHWQEVRHTPARRGFSGRAALDVGGREVRLIEVGPAHSHGDTIVHVPDARTVFAGDIVFVGSTPVMWAGPVENWLAAIELLLALDAETVVPGHGPVTDAGGVRAVRDYWLFLVPEARRRFARGEGPAEAARAIALSQDFRNQPFAQWDSPERIMTNVHLLHRQYKGADRPLGTAAVLNLLRHQAALANMLPDGRPAAMRLLTGP